jgi:hypothetical protein
LIWYIGGGGNSPTFLDLCDISFNSMPEALISLQNYHVKVNFVLPNILKLSLNAEVGVVGSKCLISAFEQGPANPKCLKALYRTFSNPNIFCNT